MLNQSYAEDKLLAELVDETGGDAALIYLGLIPFQDREGRIHGDPYVLKGRCWPRAKRMTPELIANAITACHEKQLLIRYEVGGEVFICFPSFRKNQSSDFRYERESESRIPPPPESLLQAWRKPRESVLHHSGATPEQVRTKAGATPAEVNRREGKLREEDLSPSAEETEPAPPAQETQTALAVVDRKLPQPVLTEVVRDVVRYYQQKHPGKGRQLRPGHRDWKLIEARIREGYSADDLKQAIDGNALDEWHRSNPAGHTAEYVFRNATKVEAFMATVRGGTGPPRRGRSALWDVTEDLLNGWAKGSGNGQNAIPEADDESPGLLPAAGQRR